MTPDDKRRLAEIDQQLANPDLYFSAESDRLRELTLVRRLLDEATAEASYWRKEAHREWDANNVAEVIAERDAAMAALRAASGALRSYAFGNSAPDLAKEVAEHCDRVLAAHSAATKPADAVDKEGSDG